MKKNSLAAGPVVTLNAVYMLPPRRREVFCPVRFVSGGGSGKHRHRTFQTPSYWHEEHVCFHEEAMSVMRHRELMSRRRGSIPFHPSPLPLSLPTLLCAFIFRDRVPIPVEIKGVGWCVGAKWPLKWRFIGGGHFKRRVRFPRRPSESMATETSIQNVVFHW